MNYTTYHNFDEGPVIVVEFGPMTGVGNVEWGRGNVIYEKGRVDEIQGVPEKTHFQNATEHPRVKNGQTDPQAHSEIPIIMTTEGFWPEDAL